MQSTKKIGIEKIEIIGGELHDDTLKWLPPVRDFEGADRLLTSLQVFAPEPRAYLKLDFRITFADGDTYTGRYDLTRNESPSLGQHVRDFVRYSAGVDVPPHSTREEWEDYLNFAETYSPGTRDKFIQLYCAYDLGFPEEEPEPEPEPELEPDYCQVESSAASFTAIRQDDNFSECWLVVYEPPHSPQLLSAASFRELVTAHEEIGGQVRWGNVDGEAI